MRCDKLAELIELQHEALLSPERVAVRVVGANIQIDPHPALAFSHLTDCLHDGRAHALTTYLRTDI